MQTIADRPNLRLVLMLAYSSFAVQTVTAVFALGVAGRIASLATPAYGSHDFVDVVARVLIAALCWMARRDSSAPTSR